MALIWLKKTKFYGAFREIGKPFLRLEISGKNSKNGVSGAKTVLKIKTPANLGVVAAFH